ncbi:MAG TPA: UDP-glucose/GDP-mannose dehydrogenase family protein [Actinomycetota bacterium]
MKVAVVGTGHVGLVTGCALASLGHDVVGTDASADKVAMLGRGEAPFHEPGLDDLLAAGLAAGTLSFVGSIAEAVAGAEVVFVCVGRPPVGLGDRSLSAVEDSAREIARAAADDVVLVVKSTVPPGTTARIEKVMRLERPDLRFSAVSSPEFLREGHAIDDTLRPDRLVVGAGDRRAIEVLRGLYASMIASGVRLIETDPRTAELSKLASNAFLATKISFANSLARVSELSGADVEGVTEIMGADPRIGPAFLRAGIGFGGYCLPKDIVTLERVSAKLGYDFAMLREVSRVNEEALDAVARKVEEAIWNLEGKTVALFGLAFKAGTDDVRGAPALELAARLASEGSEVVAYDPMVEAAHAGHGPIEVVRDPYAAATGAACIVVCTEWPQILELDLGRLKDVMTQPSIVDGRNLLDAEVLARAGFSYHPVGRASVELA